MKKQEQFRIVKISYFVGIFLSFLLSYLKDNIFDSYGIIGAIKVSSILTIWWLFYFNIGWKIPILNRILYRINLNGTWCGTYESVSSSSTNINKGDIVIRIKQSFLNINIISYTEKYANYSHSEEVKYDENSERYGLIYVYSQKENSPLDLAERNGTAELNIINEKNEYKLEGDFWTIMGTKGKLNLIRVSNDIVNSFKDGQNLHKKYKKKR